MKKRLLSALLFTAALSLPAAAQTLPAPMQASMPSMAAAMNSFFGFMEFTSLFAAAGAGAAPAVFHYFPALTKNYAPLFEFRRGRGLCAAAIIFRRGYKLIGEQKEA